LQKSPNREDPLLKELVAQYRDIQREYLPHPNLFAPGTSFLFNRLVHGDPFYIVEPEWQPLRRRPSLRMNLHSFAEDPQFATRVAEVDRLNVPYYLVRLPEYRELKSGKFVLSAQESGLYSSLLELTRGRVLKMDFPRNTGDVDSLFALPHDLHPSAAGNQLYAAMVTNGLVPVVAPSVRLRKVS
jgi:hypothetical protein